MKMNRFKLDGVMFLQQLIRCGKPNCRKGCHEGRVSHGPYWYAVGWSRKSKRQRNVYVGKVLPSAEILANVAARLCV